MNILPKLSMLLLTLSLASCGSGGGGTSGSSIAPVSSSASVASSEASSSLSSTLSSSSHSSASSDSSGLLSSVTLTQHMGVGWNLGNTLEAIGSETAWGNPKASQELISAVKAAGFDTIRLPVAWSRFSDEANFIIEPSWMARVEEVVNYALKADLYVLLNIHWDGGWMQPTYAEQEYVNERLAIMWTQIAERFNNYDKRLLFAGTNEVLVEGDYGSPTAEYYTVQNSFNQTFVDAVRATGGNNASRFLVVQGFNTNIDHTVNFAVMPTDSASDKLLMEVHYYDPFNFTLNADSSITQWGNSANDPARTESWAHEDFLNAQMLKMQDAFVDKGIGVILGEYGAIRREQIAGHEAYRIAWNKAVTASAITHQIAPVYWDNGGTDNGSMGLFNRDSGEQVYPELIQAITHSTQ
ncbi:glycoside hydrolase family 5 protein [Gilvimarinus polysaccharolyticus]|uniref:glycoside hydrolase family 5 protein n=1 Tax=Gilvimarinus polysaccharolyticus TaxID=863921 RepID=UPI000B1CC9B7|nr:glycoside hydrolase family 5 protein [Gilvimarinus polysaccharolyticus]